MKQQPQWCSLPYPHEAFTKLDRFAVKGQRALIFFGLYHTRPLSKVRVVVEGDAVKTAGGAAIPMESEQVYRILSIRM